MLCRRGINVFQEASWRQQLQAAAAAAPTERRETERRTDSQLQTIQSEERIGTVDWNGGEGVTVSGRHIYSLELGEMCWKRRVREGGGRRVRSQLQVADQCEKRTSTVDYGSGHSY